MGLKMTVKKKDATSSTTTPATNTTTTQKTTAPTTTPSTTTPTSTTSGGTVPNGFKGSATGVTAYNQNQSDILSQMNANSQAWHTADEAGKASLAAKNQALAQLLGGNVTFDSSTGYWSGAAEAPVETGEKPTFDYSEFEASRPDPYSGEHKTAIDNMLNEILTREDFSYDPSKDPLYGYYQDMYRREGDRARENTLADIASSAGGMNSWAVTAAQQAQNNYNAQMTDKIPELYQLAYQMYLDDKASKVQDLGLLQQMDESQYNRYRDTMYDWGKDRDFAYGMYRDDMGDYQWGTNFNYGVSQDQINNAWKDKEWDYGVSTDQYNREQAVQQDARAWALDLIASGVTPDSATLQQAGLTLDQAKQILANEQASGSRSSGGGGGGGTPSGMDLDGLFEAALASGNPYVFMENNGKKYGVSKYSDNLVDAYDEWAEERENAQNALKAERVMGNSIPDLGIGPVNTTTIEELVDAGGVVQFTDGSLAWANGWNAENWKERLEQKKIGLGGFGLPGVGINGLGL